MLPLSTDTWGDEERAAIADVMASGRYTMGERTLEFERAYARYCDTAFCVACNSGSSANLLMVAAYTLIRGGPGTVIVPAVVSPVWAPFSVL